MEELVLKGQPRLKWRNLDGRIQSCIDLMATGSCLEVLLKVSAGGVVYVNNCL